MDRRVINERDIRQVRVTQVGFLGAKFGNCVCNYFIKSFRLSIPLGMILSGSRFIDQKQAANILHEITVKIFALIRM